MKKIFTLIALMYFSIASLAQGLWIEKATCPYGNNSSVSFAIGSMGYMYTGTAANNFFMYNPGANTWTAKADFPGVARSEGAGFAIDSFGYIGSGNNVTGGTVLSDFFKYDPVADSWSAKANYPDSVWGAFSFCINNTGYFAGGWLQGGQHSTKCYAYNPVSDQWTQRDSLPSDMGLGFSAVVNSKAYCGLGKTAGALTDFVYEYDPVGDSWTQKASDPFFGPWGITSRTQCFELNNKIYVAVLRDNAGTHAAVHVFDPALDSWSSIKIYPYPSGQNCDPMIGYIGLNIAGKGYLGGKNGCTGVNFWEYAPVDSFVISSFTPDTLCERDFISVTVSSSLTFNPTNYFKLKLNGYIFQNQSTSDSVAGNLNGTYTFQVPASTIIQNNTSVAELAVYSTDPPFQTEYSSQTVFIKRGPGYFNFLPSYSACGGSTMLLYRDNYPGQTYSWTSNPSGITGTDYFVSYTPTQDVTFFTNEVYTATGCSYLDTTTVYFYAQPALNIADSLFEVCLGSTVTLGGTATPGSSYTWTGGGLNSTAVNPVVSPTTATTYHVVIKNTTSQCEAEGNTTVNITDPPSQSICFVTVDSNSTHNVIVWEKAGVQTIDSFYIYREITTNNYQQIASVHRDSLSEYHDYGANPNATAYRYKISARDTCGNMGSLSHYHNTIHLQYLGGGNLIWNVYQIENETTPVSSFDVLRDSLGNGNWAVMLTVPGTQYTATDVNFNQHPNALYRIVANWTYTCTPTRSGSADVLSNVIDITGTGIGAFGPDRAIQLYPNPATDMLTINSGGLQVEEIHILSTDAKLITVVKQPLNNSIDVSGLSAGVYLTEIKTKEGTVIKRWVKL